MEGKNSLNSRKYLENLNGNLNAVGENIQKTRKKLNYSRQYVSDRLMNYGIDVSSNSLYYFETVKRNFIVFELDAIAKILKTTSDNLMENFYNYLNDI